MRSRNRFTTMPHHRSLVQLVLGPVLTRYVDAETVRYLTGHGGTFASDVLGLLSTWAMFYVALICFYFIFCRAARGYCAWKYPKAPTSAVPERLIANMIEVSHRAFPLYVTVRLGRLAVHPNYAASLVHSAAHLPKQAPYPRALSFSATPWHHSSLLHTPRAPNRPAPHAGSDARRLLPSERLEPGVRHSGRVRRLGPSSHRLYNLLSCARAAHLC